MTTRENKIKKKKKREKIERDDILETTVVISARPTRDRDRRPSREKVIYLIAKPARYKYRGEARSASIFLRVNMRRLREKSHPVQERFSRVFTHSALRRFFCSRFATPSSRKLFTRKCNSAFVSVIERTLTPPRRTLVIMRKVKSRKVNYIFHFGAE